MRFEEEFRRWTLGRQGRANLGLTPVEAFPDSLEGSVIQMTGSGVDRKGDSARDGALEKPPEASGRQAEPADFVGEPDAESASATGTCIAVVAEDPMGPLDFFPGATLVVAVQTAVVNQRTDRLTVRALRLLDLFGEGGPFFVAMAKRLRPARFSFHKIVRIPARPSAG